MPLVDVTNIEAGRGGAKALGKPAAAAAAHPADSASEQEWAAGQEEALLARDFRKQLSFRAEDDSKAASAGVEQREEEEEEEAALAAEDSHASDASTATASGEASQLDSPMAAFAAAKARLARSNSEAGSLISATLQHVAGLREQVAAAGGGSALLRLPRQQQPRALQAAGLAGAGICGSPLPAMSVLQKRNLLLKERLHTTLQLCQTLHQQNRGNSERVAQLWADNQKLNRSLQNARLDKDGLQQTIRQLTQEAALLAQHAQRALLRAPAAPQPPAAQPVAAAAGPPAAGAARAEGGMSLVRDWSLALSAAGSGKWGAAWEPGTSVRSFDCGSFGSSGSSCSSAGAEAVVYVQGSGGGSGAAGDKRRRLAPGMLAHCLQPAISAAVAEAAAMDVARGSGGNCRMLVGTPGRTPKRKHRQVCAGGSSAAVAAAAAGPLLLAPAQQQRLCATTAPAADPELEGQCFHTFDLFDLKWHGAELAAVAQKQQAARSSRQCHGGGGCRIM